jgi:hypothetical protein
MKTKDLEIGELIYQVITAMEVLGVVHYEDDESNRLYKINLIEGLLEIREEGRKFNEFSTIELHFGNEIVFKGRWRLIFEDQNEWLYDGCEIVEYKKGPWVEELRLAKNKLDTELDLKNALIKADIETRSQERLSKKLAKRKK